MYRTLDSHCSRTCRQSGTYLLPSSAWRWAWDLPRTFACALPARQTVRLANMSFYFGPAPGLAYVRKPAFRVVRWKQTQYCCDSSAVHSLMALEFDSERSLQIRDDAQQVRQVAHTRASFRRAGSHRPGARPLLRDVPWAESCMHAEQLSLCIGMRVQQLRQVTASHRIASHLRRAGLGVALHIAASGSLRVKK